MSGRRSAFALVVAQIFSISGTRLSMIAVPWLVLTLTGDAILTGIVAFAELAPYVVAKALGGPLIDRLGARRISIFGDFGSVLAIGMVPLLDHFDKLSAFALIPLMALLGTLRGPADAAKQAMIPAVAREGKLALERMTGAMGTIERLASMVGAGAAGALVATIGAAPALIFNALTFCLSALTIVWGLKPKARPEALGAERQQSYVRQLREGFDFLRGDTVLVGIAVMIAMTNLLDQAYGAVLAPVWAKQNGHGAEMLGLLFALFSGFSMLGALIAAAIGEKLPRLPIYVGAFVLIGLPRYAVFALDVPIGAILAVLVVSGFASGFINPIVSAVILERIPENLVGRVSSLVTASAWALMPFGGIVGGVLIAATGLEATLLILGFVYLAITLAPLGLRRFRGISQRPAA